MLLVPKSRHSLSHHRSPRGVVSGSTATSFGGDDSIASGGGGGEHYRHSQMATESGGGGGGGSTTGSASTTSAPAKEHHVTTTWFLRICKLLNGVTGLAALLGIMAHFSILSVPAPAPDVALRMYGIGLCLLSILTECEWTRLFSWFGVLETWIGRGLNNILCGIMILVTSAAISEQGEDLAARTGLMRSVAGNFLIVVGVIYVLGGLACLNRVKDRHLSKLKRRDQALVQRQELETRKQEIELLLRDTESQLEKI